MITNAGREFFNREFLRQNLRKMDAGGLRTVYKNNVYVRDQYKENYERSKALVEVMEEVMKERGIE